MVTLRNQVVGNTSLCLTDHEHNALGPGLVLDTCQITLRLGAKWLTLLDDITFRNCDLIAARKLSNYLWHNAQLVGCRFHGVYSGNDFGLRPDGYSPIGGISNCDFSDSTLDGCRFFGCDMETILLPTWPCFTLTYPCERLEPLLTLDWPGNLGTWVRSFQLFPRSTIAIAEHAPTLAKKYKTTEAELRDVLARWGKAHQ